MNHSSLFTFGCSYFLIAKDNGLFWSDGNNFVPVNSGESPISWVGTAGSASDFIYYINEDNEAWFLGKLGAPLKIDKGITIKEIASGNTHTLFLSTHGDLYGMGDNHTYQLGLSGVQSYNYFLPLESPKNVALIAAGFSTSFVFTAARELHGCGGNEFGQLGLNHEYPISTFSKISF